MLRRTFSSRFYRGHTSPTLPKYTDKPGLWGPLGGPPNTDNLSRRLYFMRLRIFNRIGRMTKPFRTKRVKWLWQKFQLRAWKAYVFTCILLSSILLMNMWFSFVYHSAAIGPKTPALERKVREHRVSKQILQMVREKEKDIAREMMIEDAQKTIGAQSVKG